MPPKRCPVCKLVNPGAAQTCDCGYSFATRTPGEVPEVTPAQSLHQVAKVCFTMTIGFVLAGVIVVAAASSSFYKEVGIGLLAIGVIMSVIGRYVWRASRFT